MGEKEVLKCVYEELTALGINYYYMINDSENVMYPYVTGEYYEYEYKFEDNSSSGEVLLEVWTRGTESELLIIKDKIKSKFSYYQKVVEINNKIMSLSINYLSKTPRRTEVEGLKKLEIRLQINYWESE